MANVINSPFRLSIGQTSDLELAQSQAQLENALKLTDETDPSTQKLEQVWQAIQSLKASRSNIQNIPETPADTNITSETQEPSQSQTGIEQEQTGFIQSIPTIAANAQGQDQEQGESVFSQIGRKVLNVIGAIGRVPSAAGIYLGSKLGAWYSYLTDPNKDQYTSFDDYAQKTGVANRAWDLFTQRMEGKDLQQASTIEKIAYDAADFLMPIMALRGVGVLGKLVGGETALVNLGARYPAVGTLLKSMSKIAPEARSVVEQADEAKKAAMSLQVGAKTAMDLISELGTFTTFMAADELKNDQSKSFWDAIIQGGIDSVKMVGIGRLGFNISNKIVNKLFPDAPEELKTFLNSIGSGAFMAGTETAINQNIPPDQRAKVATEGFINVFMANLLPTLLGMRSISQARSTEIAADLLQNLKTLNNEMIVKRQAEQSVKIENPLTEPLLGLSTPQQREIPIAQSEIKPANESVEKAIISQEVNAPAQIEKQKFAIPEEQFQPLIPKIGLKPEEKAEKPDQIAIPTETLTEGQKENIVWTKYRNAQEIADIIAASQKLDEVPNTPATQATKARIKKIAETINNVEENIRSINPNYKLAIVTDYNTFRQLKPDDTTSYIYIGKDDSIKAGIAAALVKATALDRAMARTLLSRLTVKDLTALAEVDKRKLINTEELNNYPANTAIKTTDQLRQFLAKDVSPDEFENFLTDLFRKNLFNKLLGSQSKLQEPFKERFGHELLDTIDQFSYLTGESARVKSALFKAAERIFDGLNAPSNKNLFKNLLSNDTYYRKWAADNPLIARFLLSSDSKKFPKIAGIYPMFSRAYDIINKTLESLGHTGLAPIQDLSNVYIMYGNVPEKYKNDYFIKLEDEKGKKAYIINAAKVFKEGNINNGLVPDAVKELDKIAEIKYIKRQQEPPKDSLEIFKNNDIASAVASGLGDKETSAFVTILKLSGAKEFNVAPVSTLQGLGARMEKSELPLNRILFVETTQTKTNNVIPPSPFYIIKTKTDKYDAVCFIDRDLLKFINSAYSNSNKTVRVAEEIISELKAAVGLKEDKTIKPSEPVFNAIAEEMLDRITARKSADAPLNDLEMTAVIMDWVWEKYNIKIPGMYEEIVDLINNGRYKNVYAAFKETLNKYETIGDLIKEYSTNEQTKTLADLIKMRIKDAVFVNRSIIESLSHKLQDNLAVVGKLISVIKSRETAGDFQSLALSFEMHLQNAFFSNAINQLMGRLAERKILSQQQIKALDIINKELALNNQDAIKIVDTIATAINKTDLSKFDLARETNRLTLELMKNLRTLKFNVENAGVPVNALIRLFLNDKLMPNKIYINNVGFGIADVYRLMVNRKLGYINSFEKILSENPDVLKSPVETREILDQVLNVASLLNEKKQALAYNPADAESKLDFLRLAIVINEGNSYFIGPKSESKIKFVEELEKKNAPLVISNKLLNIAEVLEKYTNGLAALTRDMGDPVKYLQVEDKINEGPILTVKIPGVKNEITFFANPLTTKEYQHNVLSALAIKEQAARFFTTKMQYLYPDVAALIENVLTRSPAMYIDPATAPHFLLPALSPIIGNNKMGQMLIRLMPLQIISQFLPKTFSVPLTKLMDSFSLASHKIVMINEKHSDKLLALAKEAYQSHGFKQPFDPRDRSNEWIRGMNELIYNYSTEHSAAYLSEFPKVGDGLGNTNMLLTPQDIKYLSALNDYYQDVFKLIYKALDLKVSESPKTFRESLRISRLMLPKLVNAEHYDICDRFANYLKTNASKETIAEFIINYLKDHQDATDLLLIGHLRSLGIRDYKFNIDSIDGLVLTRAIIQRLFENINYGMSYEAVREKFLDTLTTVGREKGMNEKSISALTKAAIVYFDENIPQVIKSILDGVKSTPTRVGEEMPAYRGIRESGKLVYIEPRQDLGLPISFYDSVMAGRNDFVKTTNNVVGSIALKLSEEMKRMSATIWDHIKNIQTVAEKMPSRNRNKFIDVSRDYQALNDAARLSGINMGYRQLEYLYKVLSEKYDEIQSFNTAKPYYLDSLYVSSSIAQLLTRPATILLNFFGSPFHAARMQYAMGADSLRETLEGLSVFGKLATKLAYIPTMTVVNALRLSSLGVRTLALRALNEIAKTNISGVGFIRKHIDDINKIAEELLRQSATGDANIKDQANAILMNQFLTQYKALDVWMGQAKYILKAAEEAGASRDLSEHIGAFVPIKEKLSEYKEAVTKIDRLKKLIQVGLNLPGIPFTATLKMVEGLSNAYSVVVYDTFIRHVDSTLMANIKHGLLQTLIDNNVIFKSDDGRGYVSVAALRDFIRNSAPDLFQILLPKLETSDDPYLAKTINRTVDLFQSIDLRDSIRRLLINLVKDVNPQTYADNVVIPADDFINNLNKITSRSLLSEADRDRLVNRLAGEINMPSVVSRSLAFKTGKFSYLLSLFWQYPLWLMYKFSEASAYSTLYSKANRHIIVTPKNYAVETLQRLADIHNDPQYLGLVLGAATSAFISSTIASPIIHLLWQQQSPIYNVFAVDEGDEDYYAAAKAISRQAIRALPPHLAMLLNIIASTSTQTSKYGGDFGVSLVPVEGISSIVRTAQNIATTKDFAYPIASFISQWMPYSRGLINRLPGWEGYQKYKDANTMLRMVVDYSDIKTRRTTVGGAVSEFTPYYTSLINELMKDTPDLAKILEIRATLILMRLMDGDKNAKRSVDQSVLSRNPLRLILGRNPTPTDWYTIRKFLSTEQLNQLYNVIARFNLYNEIARRH